MGSPPTPKATGSSVVASTPVPEAPEELFRAVRDGDVATVQRYLTRGADPNSARGDVSLLSAALTPLLLSAKQTDIHL